MRLVIAATGHRFKRLGKYSPEKLDKLVCLAESYLEQYKPNKVISGMALGWDTAIALAALNLNLPLVAAIPFEGQDLYWEEFHRRRYRKLLNQSSEVILVTSLLFDNSAYLKRDIWMVDNCDKVLALWCGSNSSGTGYTVNYATKQGKEVINTWEAWLRVNRLSSRVR